MIDKESKAIDTLLIANRGEIASRIIRTCKMMGIKTVAVFSEADRGMPFVEDADMGVFIGESDPSKSYLDQDKILEVAKKVNADAIHPGYGFLSENADFARKCEADNIIFVGPKPSAIEAMGSKSMAKDLMAKHQVPIVPGYQGADQTVGTLTNAAKEIGFPVLLKATAGGGGKGMRIVNKESEIEEAIESAKREAMNAFGDDEMIVEKYIESGRHIEFQIFGDQHGNVIHLLERECSIQRRYQKVIEESPSPIMDEALRNEMGQAAVNAAKALAYDNAGTVEFIYDEKNKSFYFLEVNTRLQVEHPVTEEVTGLDLVKMQIESAQGLPLNVKQEDVKGRGYAIEARLYAEDPSNGFLPVTGKIVKFDIPKVEGLRVETAIRSGSEISIFYDPMIAKIIVFGNDRKTALRKMKYVLRNLVCLGTKTNQSFLLNLIERTDFERGEYDTHFIQNNIDLNALSNNNSVAANKAAIAATLFDWNKREKNRTVLQSIPSGWRSSFYDYQKEKYLLGEEEIFVRYCYNEGVFDFLIGEEKFKVCIKTMGETIRCEIDGVEQEFTIEKEGQFFYVHNEEVGNISLKQLERFPEKEIEKIEGGYEAAMPSQIVKVLVNAGDEIKEGDALVVLTSMKMENTIRAEKDGVVEEVFVKEGENIEAGCLLVKLG